nr:gamma-glutamyl peptidase 3-like [Tanacetum cinerariifolium]
MKEQLADSLELQEQEELAALGPRALGGKVGKSQSGWDIGLKKVNIDKDFTPCSFLEHLAKMPPALSIIECNQDEPRWDYDPGKLWYCSGFIARFIMDDPNITMEEYVRFEEEKDQKHGQTFNWQTVTYGKMKYCKDEDDSLTNFGTEYPTIVFDDTSDAALSCKPTVSPFNKNKTDFRISFDESDDEDYMDEFHAITYNDDLTKPSESFQQIEESDLTGSESRPPMLNKENYVPWLSRLLWYAKSRPNRKLIHKSILNGPYVKKMIPEPELIIVTIKHVPVSQAENPPLPLELAFNDFNYLRKSDIDLFTFDIQGMRTYKEYELNNTVIRDLEEPWSDNWVPYQLCDHTCEPYRFKNGMTKWPMCSLDIDGFCNGGELPGMVWVGCMTYFQDHKWYDELVDGKIKEETLTHKSKVEES